VPYGWALLKLYAGSRWKPLAADLDGHERGPLDDAGEEAGEPAFDEATSYSARRQASEQYTLPSVCLSQARQKSGDQSIAFAIVFMILAVGGG
jgi:hypothetical protein